MVKSKQQGAEARHSMAATIWIFAELLFKFAVITRVMSRRHRDPASRIAWVAVVAVLPGFGILIYFLFGEVNIGSRRVNRMRAILAQMPPMAEIRAGDEPNTIVDLPQRHQHLFRTATSINGFDVVGGNSARLMEGSNETIDSMIADIDAATEHVHLLFYIWLPDDNGTKMAEALKRASRRGVVCRAMADDLGSRSIIRSPVWKEMKEAGVRVASALPIGNLLIRSLHGRIDLRNHRKILVIDGRVTYCGSQNCADPEFLVKKKFAPWVDAVMRFEGPIVRQNQQLFVGDWMSNADEDMDDLLIAPIAAPQPGFPAQVIGTGPTVRYSAMPEMFESLFHAARRELTISTPYFVPDAPMQSALCAAAWRGVKTRVIFPANNDSWIVGGASRSFYLDLLEAGVEIYEFENGLLHTKSLTMDGEITLIGSANMDRRSFDLNYENNILFYDPELTRQMQARQEDYIACSRSVTIEQVRSWSLHSRLWNNFLATLGPIL